ncbi:MAG: hypothetical protein LUG23_09565 [Oscillospiraceae bacterium]|nr:hypothetical protein [Oscillospiraceae bacterium]
MNFFGRKSVTQVKFELVYQYRDGTYLPYSSQPNPSEDYEITSRQYTPHNSTRYFNVTIGENGLPQLRDKNGNLTACNKELPELYENRENCCGCTACYAICPVQAIVMRPDEEGFLYPAVDAEKCIRCHKCICVCI